MLESVDFPIQITISCGVSVELFLLLWHCIRHTWHLEPCLLLDFFRLNSPSGFCFPLQNVFPDIWSFSLLSCVLFPAGHICLEVWYQETGCHTQIYTLPDLVEQRDYFRGLSSSVVFYVAQTANLQFVVHYEFYIFFWRMIQTFLLYQKEWFVSHFSEGRLMLPI